MPKEIKMVLLFDMYGALLNETQRKIFDSYYNADLSLTEIAENFNITRQGVLNHIKTSEKKLVEYEEALNLLRKSENNSSIVSEIIDICNEISLGSDDYKQKANDISLLASKLLL